MKQKKTKICSVISVFIMGVLSFLFGCGAKITDADIGQRTETIKSPEQAGHLICEAVSARYDTVFQLVDAKRTNTGGPFNASKSYSAVLRDDRENEFFGKYDPTSGEIFDDYPRILYGEEVTLLFDEICKSRDGLQYGTPHFAWIPTDEVCSDYEEYLNSVGVMVSFTVTLSDGIDYAGEVYHLGSELFQAGYRFAVTVRTADNRIFCTIDCRTAEQAPTYEDIAEMIQEEVE